MRCASPSTGVQAQARRPITNNQPTELDSGGAARRPSAGQRASKCAPSRRPHLELQPGPSTSTSNTLGQHAQAAPWRGTPPALATSTSTAAGRCAPHFSAALLPHPGLRVKVTGHATPGPHAKLRSTSKSRTPLPPPWPGVVDTGNSDVRSSSSLPVVRRSSMDARGADRAWIVRPIRGLVVWAVWRCGAGSLDKGSNVRPAAGGGV